MYKEFKERRIAGRRKEECIKENIDIKFTDKRKSEFRKSKRREN